MTDIAIVRLGIGLVLLIAANIALGSVNAFMEGAWDMMKFRNGCIKGGVVAASLIGEPDDGGTYRAAGGVHGVCGGCAEEAEGHAEHRDTRQGGRP